tara:strand:- start:38918 stop:39727 length:810 start_codon:yes stop_codon:yes gene_type:complete
MAILDKVQSQTVGDLLTIENNNNGIDATARQIVSGNGNFTAMKTSKNGVEIKPTATDTARALRVDNKSGNHILSCDATSGQVLAGAGFVPANRNEIVFSANSSESNWAGISANNWYGLNAMGMSPSSAIPTFGTTVSSPDTSYTITNTGHQLPLHSYLINKDIYIDDVTGWIGGDASGAEASDAEIYLMSYDVVTGTGASQGDLSNGVENANATITTPQGYDRMMYINGTVTTALVSGSSARKLLVAVVRFASVAKDYSINLKIGYHYY